ncbi:MAG: HEAT repeat domain-containing protein [Syntrophomonadaceae bacterium]|nr:HEAT repeat domain-containing protein [Syntrophomonadaceae bacterium]MDD3022380.1 HEAT repeat domain-containing protein [Syntrophomonadaceae bacterium]
MSNNDELISALKSEDERDRAFAVEDIVYDKVPEAIDLLVKQLELEKSQFVREVIIRNLKTLPGNELVEKIIPLLRSDDAYIRNAIIDIISEQDKEAISLLRPLLKDSNKDIRKFTLDILFLLNSPFSKNLIAEALGDSDINMVITAVEYLGRIEASGVAPQINDLFAKSKNILLRCTCLETMALIGDDESLIIVSELYADPDGIADLEMYSYLKFLAKRGNAQHLPWVLSLIKSKGRLMAKELINTIEGIMERTKQDNLPAEMVPALSEYIASNINAINKYELLLFLGQFRNPEILQVLLDYSSSPEKLICLGAVEAVGLYGAKEALQTLKNLIKQIEDDEILEAIDKSINQLSR